jgi:hypothetical protein
MISGEINVDAAREVHPLEYRVFHQEAHYYRTAVKTYKSRVRVKSELDKQIFHLEYNHALFDTRLMHEIPRNNMSITDDNTR